MTTTPHDSVPADIVLIHGLWVTALSWEHWIERYTARGYHVIARGWPGMDVPIEQLRADPTRVADLGLAEIIDHFDHIVRELDRPPILIGHSFGGLIVQVLLDRGLGAAGVAIDPAPVKGMLALPLSTLRVSFPALRNPANVHKASALTPEQFHYAFTNTLTDEEAAAVYERYEVPGPDRVLFQAGLANLNPHALTKVNFHNDTRAPLLLIAGGKDHISPLRSPGRTTSSTGNPRRSPISRSSRSAPISRSVRRGGSRWLTSRSSGQHSTPQHMPPRPLHARRPRRVLPKPTRVPSFAEPMIAVWRITHRALGAVGGAAPQGP
jgi:alpha-beta hydrolase superfamily lysophospholipase